MTFPTYPAYKDSGVEWLGDVPEQWTLTRGDAYISSLTKVVNAETLNDKEVFHYSIPVVQASGNGQFENGSEIDSSKFLVDQPLVLISKLNPRKNTVCLAKPHNVLTICSGEFVPLQSDIIDYKWLYYLVGSENFRKRLESLVESATRSHQRVNPTDIVKFQGAFPSAPEQTQIARFLDHETARIDALIEEQQRLIELLKEKRQAVISHAVTKGLDPTVPMKDSGVEWLGEVPTHWDVARVKNIAKLESGHTPSKEYPEYWEGGDIPWVSLNDSKQLKVVDYINETQYMITALGMNNSSARLLPARAVVFTRDATIGLAAITTRKMCVSQHLIAWICIETLMLPEYLLLVFYAMEEELGRFTFGATLKTIGMPDVRKLTTTVPPLTEQAEIVAEVNSKRDLISRLISEGENGIALLQERRSALISAAVTGKIDVRSWQPPASATFPELAQEAM
ncbi:restriction endonuclease subunit S [Pseudomonas sp. 3MA1]|uniref:restriction endonuclease subunit S n=1 Tax=Pseudomonas sp. 3MA1 TaxID=2699196 RepID=UPI0023DDB2F0|nr:restriction endonuclease subunit S [Pseudomonas sp. 3MA1]MDF2396119.1 restriction endonuclease subunit S [Pseudomonas sp. 3MA1]